MLNILTFAWGVFTWIWDKVFKADIQKKQEKPSKEIDDLKAEYEKKHTIHKIKFEREFRIYRKLWEAIINLKQLAFTITPDLETAFPDYKDRLKKASKASKAVFSIVENNKPFYSSKIYDLCERLNIDCMKHFTLVAQELKEGSFKESFDSSQELVEKAKPIFQEIEQAIRNEIELIDKAGIVK